ncbi:MAG: hypothetical protein ACI4J1_11540 [Ruminiclostridium sp.]
MKLRKVLATSVAASIAASAMVFSASALVTKVDPITLDSASDTDKMVQYDLAAFGVEKIDTFTIVGQVSVGDDGWCGGGGGVGFDAVAGWTQIDFALDGENVTLDSATGDVTVVLDFAALDVDTTLDFAKEGGLLQIGWWWGSGDGTLQITDIQVNGASVMGGGAAAADGTTVAISYVADGPAYTYVVPAGMDTLNVTVAVSKADGDAFNWNDWCGAGIAVNNEKFYQWGGAQVSWGWDADGDENEDSKDGVNGETWAGTVGADGGVISIPVSEGDVVDFYCLSWDTYAGVQYTLTFEVPSAEAADVEEDDAADEDVAEEDEADEDVAEEDEADEDTADEDEAEEDTAEDEAEEDTADTTTDTTTTTGDKTTPDTGVEGVAAVAGLAVVAAGAVIIAKKRK